MQRYRGPLNCHPPSPTPLLPTRPALIQHHRNGSTSRHRSSPYTAPNHPASTSRRPKRPARIVIDATLPHPRQLPSPTPSPNSTISSRSTSPQPSLTPTPTLINIPPPHHRSRPNAPITALPPFPTTTRKLIPPQINTHPATAAALNLVSLITRLSQIHSNFPTRASPQVTHLHVFASPPSRTLPVPRRNGPPHHYQHHHSSPSLPSRAGQPRPQRLGGRLREMLENVAKRVKGLCWRVWTVRQRRRERVEREEEAAHQRRVWRAVLGLREEVRRKGGLPFGDRIVAADEGADGMRSGEAVQGRGEGGEEGEWFDIELGGEAGENQRPLGTVGRMRGRAVWAGNEAVKVARVLGERFSGRWEWFWREENGPFRWARCMIVLVVIIVLGFLGLLLAVANADPRVGS